MQKQSSFDASKHAGLFDKLSDQERKIFRIGKGYTGDLFNYDLDQAAVAQIIDDTGIYVATDFLNLNAVDAILGEANNLRWSVNENGNFTVRTSHQSFNSFVLAQSRTAFRFITNPQVLDMLSHQLGSTFRLMGARAYESRFRTDGILTENNCFHTDIETDPSDSCDSVGIIVYLTDVDDAEFQYITGSHRWGLKCTGNGEQDHILEREYAADIKPVFGKRGTVIFFHNRGLHRAKPTNHPGTRQSLLFQINRGARTGSPILIDSSFITGLDSRAETLLGFGEPPLIRIWPPTGPASLSPEVDSKAKETLDQLCHTYRRHLAPDERVLAAEARADAFEELTSRLRAKFETRMEKAENRARAAEERAAALEKLLNAQKGR